MSKKNSNKFDPPSVVKVSRQWKRIMAASRVRGTDFPGMRRLVADVCRAAVVGRYVIDDRMSGKGKKDAE